MTDDDLPREPRTEFYRGLDYTETTTGGFGEATEWASWMPTNEGKGEKLPFAKYHDHPALDYCDPSDEDDKDPRMSWSDPSNWVDFETVDEQVRTDAELHERAFIMQRETDPYTVSNDPPADPFILGDGDNVIQPNGQPIPEFIAAIELLTGGQPTWQEISTSVDGVHAKVRGSFPDDVRTRYVQLRDEPVEGYDDPPMLELYEGPKVAVLTGKQVVGTPETYADADPEGLQQLIDAGTAAHPNVLAAAKLRRKDDVEGDTTADAAGDIGESPAVFDPEAGPEDAPDDLPKCYRRTLAARYETANHATNLYAANLAIHAGYAPDEATEHFGLFPPARNESAFDARHTREELERTAAKAEAGDLGPVGVAKLRETGFFGPDETCDDDCPIHGSANSGARESMGSPSGPHTDFPIETCAPPTIDTEPFDAETVWDELQTSRFERTLEADIETIAEHIVESHTTIDDRLEDLEERMDRTERDIDLVDGGRY